MSNNSQKAAQIELHSKIEALIDKFGFAIMSVAGDEENAPFSYTVGLAQRGWPELIISTLGPSSSQMIINEVVAKLRKDRVIPAEGLIITGALNVPIVVAAVANRHLRPHLRVANERAERLGFSPRGSIVDKSLPAVQLLWPDTSGRYPNDADYDFLNFPQKMLNE